VTIDRERERMGRKRSIIESSFPYYGRHVRGYDKLVLFFIVNYLYLAPRLWQEV